MKRSRYLVVAGGAAALASLVLTLDLRVPSPQPKADPLSDIRGANVQRQYKAWAQAQDDAGGDGNLVVALGRARNHAAEARVGTGFARIDMHAGRASAEVRGLPADQSYDLWLVDNVDGEGTSAMPDPGDKLVRVGELAVGAEGVLTIDAELESNLFDRFQVDMVVVARRGEPPSDHSVLFGSLSLFQRIYAALGSPARLLASDFAGSVRNGVAGERAPLLAVRSAYAELPIAVDADVLFSNLVRRGANLFINENFNGNGRTCATCHPSLHNVTIDVQFIADLPDDDALFVAEFVPALAQNFETPKLMRGAALIRENLDGFDDLAKKFVMRSVPHVLALSTSTTPTNFPFDNTLPGNSNFAAGFPAARTGWGGDGAPNTGSLRDFATGAVTQHFPLTQARVNGKDFRLPNAGELDAMEAFQLSLGRQADVDLNALKFRDARVRTGRTLFTRLDTGNPAKPTLSLAPNPATQGPPLPAAKCNLCHSNAGATINAVAFTQLFNSLGVPLPSVNGNANFATGVNNLAALPADIIDKANNPRDGGFGLIPHDNRTKLTQIGNVPCANGRGGFGVVTLPGGILPAGLCEEDFNVPPIIEAADTPPFFHNNAVNTIEAAVAFYNDDALNNSVGGVLLKALDTNGIGIKLDTTEVTAVASMLRSLNALENIRSARESLSAAASALSANLLADASTLLDQAEAETGDALKVLSDGHLATTAVKRLRSASAILDVKNQRALAISTIVNLLNQARADIVDP